jgi:hypothetical protein
MDRQIEPLTLQLDGQNVVIILQKSNAFHKCSVGKLLRCHSIDLGPVDRTMRLICGGVNITDRYERAVELFQSQVNLIFRNILFGSGIQ